MSGNIGSLEKRVDDIVRWRADAIALHEARMDEQRALGLSKRVKGCGWHLAYGKPLGRYIPEDGFSTVLPGGDGILSHSHH